MMILFIFHFSAKRLHAAKLAKELKKESLGVAALISKTGAHTCAYFYFIFIFCIQNKTN
jgi:hypothetical protein